MSLVWGKARSHRRWIWAVGGLSHLGDLMIHQKLCMRRDAWAGSLSWWSCQSPVVHSCGFWNYLTHFCGGMFKLNAKFGEDSLLYSGSHFACDGHTVHMLIQGCLPPLLTSTVKLSLFMHAHSSPLFLAARLCPWLTKCSCYIIMAWLFPDRPCMYVFMYICMYIYRYIYLLTIMQV